MILTNENLNKFFYAAILSNVALVIFSLIRASIGLLGLKIELYGEFAVLMTIFAFTEGVSVSGISTILQSNRISNIKVAWFVVGNSFFLITRIFSIFAGIYFFINFCGLQFFDACILSLLSAAIAFVNIVLIELLLQNNKPMIVAITNIFRSILITLIIILFWNGFSLLFCAYFFIILIFSQFIFLGIFCVYNTQNLEKNISSKSLSISLKTFLQITLIDIVNVSANTLPVFFISNNLGNSAAGIYNLARMGQKIIHSYFIEIWERAIIASASNTKLDFDDELFNNYLIKCDQNNRPRWESQFFILFIILASFIFILEYHNIYSNQIALDIKFALQALSFFVFYETFLMFLGFPLFTYFLLNKKFVSINLYSLIRLVSYLSAVLFLETINTTLLAMVIADITLYFIFSIKYKKMYFYCRVNYHKRQNYIILMHCIILFIVFILVVSNVLF